jgi:hypothetical protein
MTLVPGPWYWECNSNVTLWRGANKNQRVKVRKPSSLFACRRGRCRGQRLGCAAWVSHGRAVGISYFRTSPTNPFLCWQRLRARFLPRAFAAFVPGRGSRGGALTQVFAETATLALITPQANEPIVTDSVELMTAAMDPDAAPGDGAVFPARLAARSSGASSCS